MKWFARRRRARTLEKALGTGLWRQAHDRFIRGLDRYHQVLEGVADDEVYNALVEIGDSLAQYQQVVFDLCAEAHQLHPAKDMRVPAGGRDLHAQLSKAANHVATTAEAEALVRLGQADVTAVRRRAQQVIEALEAAQAAGTNT